MLFSEDESESTSVDSQSDSEIYNNSLEESEVDNLVNNLNRSLKITKMPNVSDVTLNHIALIPTYEGDPNTLTMYISSCEYLISRFASKDTTADINEYLLRLFQSKLSGKALQLVGSRETLTDWTELKELLELNFCDQRSENCLLQDLMQLRPDRGESAYNFGLRCKNVLNLLLTKVKMSVTDANKRSVKVEMHKDTALQTFLRGITQFGEIGHRVRFRTPENLEKAMSLVLEEENFNYLTRQPNNVNKTEFRPIKQKIPLVTNTWRNQQTANFRTQAPPQHNVQGASSSPFQYKPPAYTYKPFTQYTQQRTPQASSFRFARTPGQIEHKRQPRQTPMEIDSARTGIPGTSRQNIHPAKPTWTSGELYHQMTEETPEYYEETYETYNPEENYEEYVGDDTEETYNAAEEEAGNFHTTASGMNHK